MNKITIALSLVIICSCKLNKKEGFQYNNKYEVTDIEGIESFLKLNKYEGQLFNLQLSDTASNQRSLLKNRYRYYYDTVIRGGEEVEIIKKRKDYSGFCICNQKNDTIVVSMISAYRPPLADIYEIQILKTEFKSYQKTVYPGQNRLLRQTHNKYQNLKLLNKPSFNDNEEITGFLYFKTRKHDQSGNIFSGGMYFTCEVSKENYYPPY